MLHSNVRWRPNRQWLDPTQRRRDAEQLVAQEPSLQLHALVRALRVVRQLRVKLHERPKIDERRMRSEMRKLDRGEAEEVIREIDVHMRPRVETGARHVGVDIVAHRRNAERLQIHPDQRSGARAAVRVRHVILHAVIGEVRERIAQRGQLPVEHREHPRLSRMQDRVVEPEVAMHQHRPFGRRRRDAPQPPKSGLEDRSAGAQRSIRGLVAGELAPRVRCSQRRQVLGRNGVDSGQHLAAAPRQTGADVGEGFVADDPTAQGLALQELGDRVDDPVGVAEVVDGEDVGVGERGHRLGLALEPRQSQLVLHQMLGQHLDGNRAIEGEVGGEVDLAHAAGAEAALDPEMAELLAGGELVGWSEQGGATGGSAIRRQRGRRGRRIFELELCHRAEGSS